MLRIGIKYCGGCNPSYERVETVHRAQSQSNHPFHFVHHDRPDIDGMILMSGCQRACAVQGLNRTMTHFSVTGENDFEALMDWLKSLAAIGKG
jgi:4-hydroxybutyrate CoA-transferase